MPSTGGPAGFRVGFSRFRAGCGGPRRGGAAGAVGRGEATATDGVRPRQLRTAQRRTRFVVKASRVRTGLDGRNYIWYNQIKTWGCTGIGRVCRERVVFLPRLVPFIIVPIGPNRPKKGSFSLGDFGESPKSLIPFPD